MQLAGFYAPSNFFDFMNGDYFSWFPKSEMKSNLVKLGIREQDAIDYINSGAYWEGRRQFWAQSADTLTKMLDRGLQENYEFKVQRSIEHVAQNRSVWDAVNGIINSQNGAILSWDTETIGDFASGDVSNVLGVTEIGYTIKNYSGRYKETSPNGSFLIGINEEQKAWLENILEKKKAGQILTSTEESAMERMSHYSTIQHGNNVFSTRQAIFDKTGKKLTFVNSLNISNADSVKDIESGINALYSEYLTYAERGLTQEEIINTAVREINDFAGRTKNNRRAIVGQNLAYDINVINMMSKKSNGAIDAITFDRYADTMEAIRAYANISNKTIAEVLEEQSKQYGHRITNPRTGSLEAFMEAIGFTDYARNSAHNAFEDSKATITILEKLDIVRKAEQVMYASSNGSENTINLADAAIKINTTANNRATDIIMMHDGTESVVTTRFQASNQYWKFGGVFDNTSKEAPEQIKFRPLTIKAGKKSVNLNTKMGDYSIVFFSEVDDATLLKTFGSKEEADDWLRYNTTIIENQNYERISREAMQATRNVRDKDIARRVIDGFFDVNTIGATGNKQNITEYGGFSAMHQYYSVYEELASLSDDVVTGMNLVDANGTSIKTAKGLIENIAVGNNMRDVLAYADRSKTLTAYSGLLRNSKELSLIESENGQITGPSAGNVAIKRFDERYIMRETFNMFENNQEFFGFADTAISGMKGDNVSKTIALNRIAERYKDIPGVQQTVRDFALTNEDIHNVSMRLNDGSYTLINLADKDKAIRQINRAYSRGLTLTSEISLGMRNGLFELADRGVITRDAAEKIWEENSARRNPYTLAQSIGNQLYSDTQNIRNLTVEQYTEIFKATDFSGLNQSGWKHNITEAEFLVARSKNTTFLDISASSGMSLMSYSGRLDTSPFQDIIRRTESDFEVHTVGNQLGDIHGNAKPEIFDNIGAGIIEHGKNATEYQKAVTKRIETELKRMGYSEEDIRRYSSIFYQSPSARGWNDFSLGNINTQLLKDGRKGDVIRPLFVATEGEYSDFMVFTRDSQYKSVLKALSNLETNGERVKPSQIKKSLEGIATYQEIPYLKTIDIRLGDEYDDKIRALYKQEHGPRTVMVQQGEHGYYKYDTFKFNTYIPKKSETGKIEGYFQAPGGSYLTNSRASMETIFEMTASGDYSSATRLANRRTRDALAEAASPLQGGFSQNGEYARRHLLSQQDVSMAYAVATDDARGGIKQLLKEFTDDPNNIIKNKNVATDTLREIVNVFYNEYGYLAPEKITRKEIDFVFDSEPFRIFSMEYMSKRSGGIKNNALIKNSNNSNIIKLLDATTSSGEKIGDLGITEILNEAIKTSDKAGDSLREAFQTLVDLDLDWVNSETAAHHNIGFAGIGPGIFNNSLYGGIYRPTYAQRANYRPYTLKEDFFDNAKNLAANKKFVFGDVFTTRAAITYQNQHASYYAEAQNIALNDDTMLRRNIVGAVQSISNEEIQAGKDRVLRNITSNVSSEDRTILTRLHERIYSAMNLHEGKFFVDPSLANQPFFRSVDPKTINIKELTMLTEGTGDYTYTRGTLNGFLNKRLENGTIIGARTLEDGTIKSIYYNGPSISNLTKENIEELLTEGRTEVIPERQIGDFKLFIGNEKGTAESVYYFNTVGNSSANKQKRLEEIRQFARDIGFSDDTLRDLAKEDDEFLAILDKLNSYSDTIMKEITSSNKSDYRTLVIYNNNIAKHITDSAFDSKWNVIAMEYGATEESRKAFTKLLYDIDRGGHDLGFNLAGENGLIQYSNLRHSFFFTENSKKTIQALDLIEDTLRGKNLKGLNIDETGKYIVEQLDAIAKGEVAVQSIQRQYMNEMQSNHFNMDSRIRQGIIMQAMDDENYLKQNGVALLKQIDENALTGWYDDPRNISRVMGVGANNGLSNYDSVWTDMVRSSRGTIRPRDEQRMFVGITDTITNIQKPTNINESQIIKLNASDIIKNIPKSGASNEAYQGFIFSIDGKLGKFLKESAMEQGIDVANIGENKVTSFFLDLSDFTKAGVEFKRKGKALKFFDENTQGILLPIQNISITGDEYFTARSASETVAFFNALKGINTSDARTINKVNAALDNLFDAFEKELDPTDKKSLVSRQSRYAFPNSTGALALDASIPVSGYSFDDFEKYRQAELKVAADSITGNIYTEQGKRNVEEYIALENARHNIITDKAKQIRTSKNIFPFIQMTGDKDIKGTGRQLYQSLIRGTNDETIESAVVVGREILKGTQMDPGHIGYQVVTDYYRQGFKPGIKAYDSFDRLTRQAYTLDEVARQNMGSKLNDRRVGEIVGEILDKLDDTAKARGSQGDMWAQETKQIIESITKEARINNLSDTETTASILEEFNKRVNIRLSRDQSKGGIAAVASNIAGYQSVETEKIRQQFVKIINEGFGEVGEDYLSRVGFLGQINRYPNFSHTGLLPVRVFFDASIEGNMVRLLGPQFSIFQNVDFDGDNEFLKFLGNGGLWAKQTYQEVFDKKTKKATKRYVKNPNMEGELLEKQFNIMNKLNREVFAASIESQDSFKAYKIGDENYFKSVLLRELDTQRYDSAVEQYKKAISLGEGGQERLKWFNNLVDSFNDEYAKQKGKEIQEIILANSIQMKKAFIGFENEIGVSMSNESMIRAAMQARTAKEYIGNYSKVNLSIREALTYMLGKAETPEEEKELLSIKRRLVAFGDDFGVIGNNGALSLLEQKGIDTKHVHDAELLNRSENWRTGIRSLFSNSMSHEGISLSVEEIINKQRMSLKKVVLGSEKVFFPGLSNSPKGTIDNIINLIMSEEVSKARREITSRTFDSEEELFKVFRDIVGKTAESVNKDHVQGILDLNAIYNLSNMRNAYEGMNGVFKNADIEALFGIINESNIEDLAKLYFTTGGMADTENFTMHMLSSLLINGYKRDEQFRYGATIINPGDIIGFMGEDGPKAYIFHENQYLRGNDYNGLEIRSNFRKLDLKTGEISDNIETLYTSKTETISSGTKKMASIRDLNEQIKREGRILTGFGENSRFYKINNIAGDETALKTLRRQIFEENTASILDEFFVLRDTPEAFEKFFRNVTDPNNKALYQVYSSLGYGNVVRNIVGDDPELLRQRINTIVEEIENVDIREGLRGNLDSKKLIRGINRRIASMPPRTLEENLSDRFSDTISYLGGRENASEYVYDAYIQDFGNQDIKRIIARNNISKKIISSIERQEKAIDSLGRVFLNRIENAANTEEANKISQEIYTDYEKEIRSNMQKIFGSIEETSEINAKEYIAETFNWKNISNKDFQITANNSIIESGAKIGYGQFIGKSISDISYEQSEYILRELERVSKRTDLSELERHAIAQTKEILNRARNLPHLEQPFLSFDTPEALRNSAKVLLTDSEAEINEEARKAIFEGIKNASENTEKKTLGKEIIKGISELSPGMKRGIAIGASVLGGTALLSAISHTNMNKDIEKGKEVPATDDGISGDNKIFRNKNNLDKPNTPSEAKSEMRRKHTAPATPKIKTRTIYHDTRSGFNFKVSAQSYRKLAEQSYQSMANSSNIGNSNTTLNVRRDNSRITDNWLQNKFSDLTE